jgi:hypothetical protein
MKYPNQYKIAVAGAAETEICCSNIKELCKEVGREIVRQGCTLITGATTGAPYYTSMGAHDEKGVSIGLSPAATEIAHVRTYRLPVDTFDVVIYTGFGYAGRNLLMTRSADGVIVICGRMGTLNEFTIAFEDEKPIGILVGSGGTADKIKDLVRGPYRGKKKIVYESDPKKLVSELIKLIKKEKGRYLK